MVRYVLAKVLRGVKALQIPQKSANGFENLLLQGLQGILKMFKVNLAYNFFKFIRKLRSTIE